MIQYEEIHDLLQTQVDNGDLSVSEASLVDNIAFIGDGLTMEAKEDKTVEVGPYTVEIKGDERIAKETIQRLSKEYRVLNAKCRKEIKSKDYNEASKTIKKQITTLTDIKDAIQKVKFPSYKFIRNLLGVATFLNGVKLGPALDSRRDSINHKKFINNQHEIDTEISNDLLASAKRACDAEWESQIKRKKLRDDTEFIDDIEYTDRDIRKENKKIIKRAGFIGANLAASAVLKNAKSIVIKVLNKKIANLKKTEKKIQKMMTEEPKKSGNKPSAKDMKIGARDPRSNHIREVRDKLAMTNAKIERAMDQLSEAKTSNDKQHIKFQIRQLNEQKDKLQNELRDLNKESELSSVPDL